MLAGLGQGVVVAADQGHHIRKLAAVDIFRQGNALAVGKYVGQIIFADTDGFGDLRNGDPPVNVLRNIGFCPGTVAAVAGGVCYLQILAGSTL